MPSIVGANDGIAAMRTLIPFVSVLLAVVAAGSIAYIAWEVTRPDELDDGRNDKPDKPNARKNSARKNSAAKDDAPKDNAHNDRSGKRP